MTHLLSYDFVQYVAGYHNSPSSRIINATPYNYENFIAMGFLARWRKIAKFLVRVLLKSATSCKNLLEYDDWLRAQKFGRTIERNQRYLILKKMLRKYQKCRSELFWVAELESVDRFI
jgi:hypothetical protein